MNWQKLPHKLNLPPSALGKASVKIPAVYRPTSSLPVKVAQLPISRSLTVVSQAKMKTFVSMAHRVQAALPFQPTPNPGSKIPTPAHAQSGNSALLAIQKKLVASSSSRRPIPPPAYQPHLRTFSMPKLPAVVGQRKAGLHALPIQRSQAPLNSTDLKDHLTQHFKTILEASVTYYSGMGTKNDALGKYLSVGGNHAEENFIAKMKRDGNFHDGLYIDDTVEKVHIYLNHSPCGSDGNNCAEQLTDWAREAGVIMEIHVQGVYHAKAAQTNTALNLLKDEGHSVEAWLVSGDAARSGIDVNAIARGANAELKMINKEAKTREQLESLMNG